MACTIYGLRDPLNNQIRYVGCTSQSLKARLSGHIGAYALAVASDQKREWILELRKSGLRPIIEPLEMVEDCRARVVEFAWIRLFVQLGAKLVNDCDPHPVTWDDVNRQCEHERKVDEWNLVHPRGNQ